VLAGINFSVRPGQTVAIVGQTGAGKTSLVRLVSRIYDVTGGRYEESNFASTGSGSTPPST